jgi:hypothetical protein
MPFALLFHLSTRPYLPPPKSFEAGVAQTNFRNSKVSVGAPANASAKRYLKKAQATLRPHSRFGYLPSLFLKSAAAFPGPNRPFLNSFRVANVRESLKSSVSNETV